MRRFVALAAVAAALVTVTSCAAPDAPASPTPSVAGSPSASAGPRDVDIADLGAKSVPVQPHGDFLMSSGDLVWVSGVGQGIIAYDASMQAAFRVYAGTVWAALEYGDGYVWASETTDHTHATTLLRIDPGTGKVTRFAVPSPGIPEESSIGVTDDAVWVLVPTEAAGGEWTLVGLDPATGAEVRTLDIGTDVCAAVRGGFGSLWVTKPSGLLARIDPETGKTIADIQLPESSTFLSIGPDAVWVMSRLGDVTRVDPSTNEVVATIVANPDGIEGGDIVASADAVWVQATTLLGVEIDPATNTVVQRVGPPQGSGGVAITADGAVWITAHDEHMIYRIPPG